MKRSIAILLAAGLGVTVAATPSLAVNLGPASYHMITGWMRCCPTTDLCREISREVEALSDEDGVCLSFDADPGGDRVTVELVFYSTLEPGPFLLKLVADGEWHEVKLMNWSTGELDDLPLTPTAEETTWSGVGDVEHVDAATGAIVVTLSATYPDPLARDEKTLDEVEIVIPPPE